MHRPLIHLKHTSFCCFTLPLVNKHFLQCRALSQASRARSLSPLPLTHTISLSLTLTQHTISLSLSFSLSLFLSLSIPSPAARPLPLPTLSLPVSACLRVSWYIYYYCNHTSLLNVPITAPPPAFSPSLTHTRLPASTPPSPSLSHSLSLSLSPTCLPPPTPHTHPPLSLSHTYLIAPTTHDNTRTHPQTGHITRWFAQNRSLIEACHTLNRAFNSALITP